MDIIASSIRISAEPSMAELIAETLDEIEVQIVFEGLINSKGWTL